MNDEKSTSLVDELMGSLEENLEERKEKKDRRKAIDANSPYASAELDRRKGQDRRDIKKD